MRSLYAILTIVLTGNICAAQHDSVPCPPEGSATIGYIRYMNVLKNRDITPGKLDNTITLDTLLKGGPDDSARFSPEKYVTLTGWVVEAQDEGPASCNCLSNDSAKHGIKIYLASSLQAWKDSIIMVEITPKFNALHHYTAEGLFEEKIQLTGYLVFNHEAKKYSLNACKKCHTTDRKTAWEICPITDLKIMAKELPKETMR